jgi:hypothetical protein
MMNIKEENLFIAFRELFEALSTHDEDRERAAFELFVDLFQEYMLSSGEVLTKAVNRFKNTESRRTLG